MTWTIKWLWILLVSVAASEGVARAQSAPQGVTYTQDRGVRAWLHLNAGAAASGAGTHTSTLLTPRSGETQTTQATYGKQETGTNFDLGGGYMISSKFGVGLNVSATAHKGKVDLKAIVPSPFQFNDHATATLTSPDEFTRTERAVSVQAVFAPVNSRRLLVQLFAGPTYFRTKADMVKVVKFNASFATFRGLARGTITGHESGTGEGSGLGFHLGTEASYFFSRVIGIGVFGRYNRATVKVDDPLSSPLTPTQPNQVSDLKVGGLQLGGGLRFRF